MHNFYIVSNNLVPRPCILGQDGYTSHTYVRTRLRVQLGQLKTQIHKFPYMFMAYSKGASILTKSGDYKKTNF